MRIDRSNKGVLSQWWWTIDRTVLYTIFALIGIGIVLVMAASPTVAESHGLDSMYFVYRQLLFLFVGICGMLIVSILPVVVIRRLAVIGFLSCVILLIAVLVFGQEIKGARRWLFIAGFSLQPSEFIKPFIAIVVAWVLARKYMVKDYPGFRIAIVLYVIVVALLLKQPDFGMTMAVSAVWGVQMFLAGIPLLFVAIIGVLGIAGIVAAYSFLPHVAKRINNFLDPQSGDNYQVERATEAIMNGGIFGRGPGQGVVKESVPDAHTDFIFAVAGEELGMAMCLVIVGVYVFLVMRIFSRIKKENNLFVMLATAGLAVQLAVQALVNMGVALSLLPNTGMTLPLISYGGSSTIAISLSLGMILAFTRKRYGVNAIK